MECTADRIEKKADRWLDYTEDNDACGGRVNYPAAKVSN